MAPRNNDASTSFKKKNFSVDNDSEVDVKNIVPCLLHKKHKVVKLVKSQLQKIHEEGLFCGSQGPDTDIFFMDEKRKKLSSCDTSGENMHTSRPSTSKDREGIIRYMESEQGNANGRSGGICLCFYLLTFFISMFLLIFIAVWVSAGPLSNAMAHTPIPAGSFVRTDGLCSLEKKYLLRWSKPEYFE